MAEEVLKQSRNALKEQEEKLKEAKKLIDTLRKAGEPTAELEKSYREAEARLRRWKLALGVK